MTDSPLPDFDAVLGAESVVESAGDEDERHGPPERDKSREDAVRVPLVCPDCGEGMSINTVVAQEDRKRNGRTRHEGVCTDCQTAVIITVMKTVGDYNELMGFDSMEMDWDIEDIDPDE
jgi:hypothetical protein